MKEFKIKAVIISLLLAGTLMWGVTKYTESIRNAGKQCASPLIVDDLSKELMITAETEDGVIMGVQHKKFNIHGVQFHPESIKTKFGMKILRNFINY